MENSVQLYISNVDEDRKLIMTVLHDYFMQLPNVSCKLAYGLPFYYVNRKRFAYFNQLKKGGVDIGMTTNYKNLPESLLINAEKRKMVCSIPVKDIEFLEDNFEEIQRVILELIDYTNSLQK